MKLCDSEIEKCLEKGVQQKESKKMMKQLKTVRSFLSLENMAQSDSEEEEEVESLDEDNKKEDVENEKLDKEKIEVHPLFVLDKAFAQVNSVGSATAMVAILNGKKLSIANLGDSGFTLIRFKNGEAFTFSKSKEQQHNFNIPFQLSCLPKERDFETLES